MTLLDISARAASSSGPTTERIKFVRQTFSLVVFALLSLCALPAQARDCSDYVNGTLDGFAGDIAPSQLRIDRNCTIRNYPASQ